MMNTPKIRTIAGAVEDLRREDPFTPVTAYALRKWIKSGELTATKNGNRYLINMSVLYDFLGNEDGTGAHDTEIHT